MIAPDPDTADNDVAQLLAPVLANERVGAYHRLTLGAPPIARFARAGQFVAVAVAGPGSSMLLRRSFSIHRTRATTGDEGGPDGGTVDIVVADAGPGTEWITSLQPGSRLDVIGPLGRPFPVPEDAGPVVLVGGGYGSAPMFWLADVLRDNGFGIHHVIGAASSDRLFGARLADPRDELIVTTDDGSQGLAGRVTTPLPALLQRTGAATLYACGPMPMLRAVTQVVTEHEVSAYVAVEEAMACGIGVCMTCVLPVIGPDGITRMSRACFEGPVFEGSRVRWDAIADGRVVVPDDCFGSPARAALDDGTPRWT